MARRQVCWVCACLASSMTTQSKVRAHFPWDAQDTPVGDEPWRVRSGLLTQEAAGRAQRGLQLRAQDVLCLCTHPGMCILPCQAEVDAGDRRPVHMKGFSMRSCQHHGALAAKAGAAGVDMREGGGRRSACRGHVALEVALVGAALPQQRGRLLAVAGHGVRELRAAGHTQGAALQSHQECHRMSKQLPQGPAHNAGV